MVDENDNIPKFSQSVYQAAVAENRKHGSSVIQVTANDPDGGNNGKLTYSLFGGDENFKINSTSGNWVLLIPELKQ